MESGGSWLSFDRLIDKNQNLRFAVVLNFDTFREDNNIRNQTQCRSSSPGESFTPSPSPRPLNELRSRGILVKDFIDSDVTAEDYATRMFEERQEFRPFNLIISDGVHGAYYISSSVQQHEPIRLDAGVLYGISNGFLFDNWQKVSLGQQLISKLLGEHQESINKEVVQYQEQLMRQQQGEVEPSTVCKTKKDFTTVTSIQDIERELTVSPSHMPTSLPQYLNQLLNTLKVSEALADPLFQMKSKALSQIAAIYVKPTVILMHDLAFARNIPWVNHHILLQPYLNKEVEPHWEDPFYEEALLGKIVFATRTHTLFLHWSTAFLNQQSAAAEVDAKDSIGRSPLFCILECDNSFHWNDSKHLSIGHDINCFHNFS
jgi:hypothetical protein